MFEGLRKKLSEAIKGFAKKEEEQIKEEPKVPITVQEKAMPATPKQEKVTDLVNEKKEGKKEEPVKLSITTKIKAVFSSSITLKDGEIDGFLDGMKISLLQSDVSYDATEYFLEDLRQKLQSAKIDSKNIQHALIDQVRTALLDTLNKGRPGFQIYDLISQKIAQGGAPVKILFLGPNGTGKTTTMAKIAYALKKKGTGSVLSASDTFRAAAIEQTEHHAKSVGVPVIKSSYGADPASIAFDAIAYAKAHNIEVVLIDTAGRQETNRNLITEMQKMVRVSKPDITLFVGESTAGNQLTEQIKEFSKHIRIDGIILTKLDCDAKGGNAISMAYSIGIPLVLIGTGEAYEALVQYSPQLIVDMILPNS